MSNLKHFAIKWVVIGFVITGSIIMLKVFGISYHIKGDIHNHKNHYHTSITHTPSPNKCQGGKTMCLELKEDVTRGKVTGKIYCAEGKCDE